jgi:hypothetical protein
MREELRPATFSDFGVTKCNPGHRQKLARTIRPNPPVSCRIYIQRMEAQSQMAGGLLITDLTDSTCRQGMAAICALPVPHGVGCERPLSRQRCASTPIGFWLSCSGRSVREAGWEALRRRTRAKMRAPRQSPASGTRQGLRSGARSQKIGPETQARPLVRPHVCGALWIARRRSCGL